MDWETAKKYADSSTPLNTPKKVRQYRTRVDPLDAFWGEIVAMLEQDPRIKPYAILEFMNDKHQEEFPLSLRRSLERRILDWRLDHGVEKDVKFAQIHIPGDVLAFDFTDVSALAVTVQGKAFPHLLFHSTLTYSNWEYAEVCFSESFESVARGVQNSYYELGGVTQRLRNDSLTAAVNNLSSDREFQPSFKALLAHFGVYCHRINVRSPHENGDCESSHGHFKDYLDQQLRLRGDRNFDSPTEWEQFMKQCLARCNQQVQAKSIEERKLLAPLPKQPFPTYTEKDMTLRSNAILRIKQNDYSISSRFIGLKLNIRIHPDQVEVWYGGKLQITMPRLVGKKQVYFDYRDVIDSLHRKPNAFANFQYRDWLYPSLAFRIAFDQMEASLGEPQAIKDYLKILYKAKYEGHELIEKALRCLLDLKEPISLKAVAQQAAKQSTSVPESKVADVCIEAPDLADYDEMLKHKEVFDERTDEDSGSFASTLDASPSGWPIEGIASSNDPSMGDETSGPCSPGELDAYSISGRIDDERMRGTNAKSSGTPSAPIEVDVWQDLERNRLDENPNFGSSPNGSTSHGGVSAANGERADFWSAGYWEDTSAERIGRATGSAGPSSMLCTLCDVGSTATLSEKRIETTTIDCEAGTVQGVDHRRLGLRPAEPGGDGSALYTSFGTVRENECAGQLQLTIFEVGTDIQRSDDNSGSDRPSSASQRDHGAQRLQLSPGSGQGKPASPIACQAQRFNILSLQIEEISSGILVVAKVGI